jgi:hypothetical protein
MILKKPFIRMTKKFDKKFHEKAKKEVDKEYAG